MQALEKAGLNLSDAQNDAINTMLSAPSVAQFPVKDAQQLFTKFVLESAGKEADDHVSRATNRTRVTEYLNLFGLNFPMRTASPTLIAPLALGLRRALGIATWPRPNLLAIRLPTSFEKLFRS